MNTAPHAVKMQQPPPHPPHFHFDAMGAAVSEVRDDLADVFHAVNQNTPHARLFPVRVTDSCAVAGATQINLSRQLQPLPGNAGFHAEAVIARLDPGYSGEAVAAAAVEIRRRPASMWS